MRKRSQKTMVGFIVIFVLAFVLAFAAVQLLPIPGDLKKMVFFLLIPAVSAAGVFVLSKLKRR